MEETKIDDIQIAFHDLLNFATSIRSIVYIILLEKTQPDKQTEDYLKDCLNRSSQLIKGLENLRKKWLGHSTSTP